MIEQAQTEETPEKTYNRIEAAKFLGISDTQIYNLFIRKELTDPRPERGKIVFYEHELQAYLERRKEQSLSRTETAPADVVPTDPDAIRDEVLLLSRALGTIGQSVPGFKSIKQFQEVQPTSRVWDVDVETGHGCEKWQVISDMDDMRVQRIG